MSLSQVYWFLRKTNCFAKPFVCGKVTRGIIKLYSIYVQKVLKSNEQRYRHNFYYRNARKWRHRMIFNILKSLLTTRVYRSTIQSPVLHQLKEAMNKVFFIPLTRYFQCLLISNTECAIRNAKRRRVVDHIT